MGLVLGGWNPERFDWSYICVGLGLTGVEFGSGIYDRAEGISGQRAESAGVCVNRENWIKLILVYDQTNATE